MLKIRYSDPARSRGTSLIEVLVTLVILAFGLLGVAGLQAKIGAAEMESYQRAQALLALSQMTEVISANPVLAASYVTGGTVGTGDAEPADCTTIAPGPNRDLCDWSSALKGAGEQTGGANTGAMIGARGCVTQVLAPNPTLGVCTAGVYQVSVAWQGTVATAAAPALACATGLYGANNAFRRVVAVTVSTPTTGCY